MLTNLMQYILFLSICLFSNILIAMAPKPNWEKAVDIAIIKYGLRTEPELKHFFALAGIAYPPQNIAYLAFKKERRLELWAKDEKHTWQIIHSYPLTAFSGKLGPKLKEQDKQIPEGIYRLTTLNPFSSMHLSMMIDYPNHFDRLQAQKEGRKRLGNNIFLHGKSLSVGCLAVGDRAIDQLFLLTGKVGLKNTRLIIAPNDLRVSKPATSLFAQPRWLPELYQQITTALKAFPANTRMYKLAALKTTPPQQAKIGLP